jgi:hypothetical protein
VGIAIHPPSIRPLLVFLVGLSSVAIERAACMVMISQFAREKATPRSTTVWSSAEPAHLKIIGYSQLQMAAALGH